MNYQLVLNFKTQQPSKVLDIIQVQSGKMDRSAVSIKKTKNNIEFNIKAKDAIALKASINSIIKGLNIYEKTKELIKND